MRCIVFGTIFNMNRIFKIVGLRQQLLLTHLKVPNKLFKFAIMKAEANNLVTYSSNTYGKFCNFWKSKKIIPFLASVTLLRWLGFENADETESELIITLKRSVICSQKQEYDKAEKMLHLALRLAQQQQNRKGILYCYDLMANLAMETYQLQKAQKIFVLMMQMFLEDGLDKKDLKFVHVSLKVARINHLLANEDVAEIGFKWCLENINKFNIEADAHIDTDSVLLYGIINDWYAQFLLDQNQVDKALYHLKEAYNCCCRVQAPGSNEQVMLLLNDLGILSWRAGNVDDAQSYLEEALSLGNLLRDQTHVGVILANLGLVLLQKGFAERAKELCVKGWKIGKLNGNYESIEQANYCLDQVKYADENKFPKNANRRF